MNNFYLNRLERLLQKVPEAERRDILQDYREHFRLAEEEGKSLDEIIHSLGDPEALAKDILADYGEGYEAKEEGLSKRQQGWLGKWGLLTAAAGVVFIGAALWMVWGNGDGPSFGHSPAAPPAVGASDAAQSPAAGAVPPEKHTPAPVSALAGDLSSADKPGGESVIQEVRTASGPVRHVRVETVDTNLELEFVKGDSAPQALLDGRMTVQPGEDWRSYYQFTVETEAEAFTVKVRYVEAMAARMPKDRRTKLRIRLPDAKLDSLSITTVSGDVKAAEVKTSQFRAALTSGDLTLDRLEAAENKVSNVSGNIAVRQIKGNFEINTVSGDVGLGEAAWEGNSSVQSVSGNVKVKSVKELIYRYDLTAISGETSCGFAEAVSSSGLLFNQCSGGAEDSNRTLLLTTVSGSLYTGP